MNKVWNEINNRDIRFRVFDRPSQRMLYQKDFQFSFNQNGFEVIETTVTPKITMHMSISDNLNGHLMEYSGFKDMEGVDIYEGDILEKEMYGKKVYYEVEHSNGSWKIRNHHDYIHLATIRVLSKVIGNIYQNSNIL